MNRFSADSTLWQSNQSPHQDLNSTEWMKVSTGRRPSHRGWQQSPYSSPQGVTTQPEASLKVLLHPHFPRTGGLYLGRKGLQMFAGNHGMCLRGNSDEDLGLINTYLGLTVFHVLQVSTDWYNEFNGCKGDESDCASYIDVWGLPVSQHLHTSSCTWRF